MNESATDGDVIGADKEVFNRQFSLLLLRNAQLQRRVKTFQEGYRDKAFEVIALEIQILDIKATGYDERLERNFESMKRKCLVAIEERNEARKANAELAKFAEHAPHCKSHERYPSPPCDCGLELALLNADTSAHLRA